MRVIAGELRSRKLKSPEGLDVRPTPDRLREALFNILAPIIAGKVFVDGYAGCGSVGIEALSRGAERVIFIEKSKEAIRILGENLRTLGLVERSKVIRGGVATYIGEQHADLVFLDPPYDLTAEYDRCLEILGKKPPPLVVVQHASRYQLPEANGELRRYRVVKHGDNSLSFYTGSTP